MNKLRDPHVVPSYYDPDLPSYITAPGVRKPFTETRTQRVGRRASEILDTLTGMRFHIDAMNRALRAKRDLSERFAECTYLFEDCLFRVYIIRECVKDAVGTLTGQDMKRRGWQKKALCKLPELAGPKLHASTVKLLLSVGVPRTHVGLGPPDAEEGTVWGFPACIEMRNVATHRTLVNLALFFPECQNTVPIQYYELDGDPVYGAVVMRALRGFVRDMETQLARIQKYAMEFSRECSRAIAAKPEL